MAYNGDITWQQLTGTAANKGQANEQLQDANHQLYLNWLSFQGSPVRTNAEIASDLTLKSGVTVTETMVAELAAYYSALEASYADYVASRAFAVRVFS